jgi:phosphatidylserine/phosphatidylglycerophosphate/cardiolipin synthase-like enzyme
MRTTHTWQASALALLGLSLAGASTAFAQPAPDTPSRPGHLEPREEAALRNEIKRFELEHTRYERGATGLEGIWTLTGSRHLVHDGQATDTAITGEVAFARQDDGSFKLTGTAYLDGRTTGRFAGRGTTSDSNRALSGTYKATIAGEGALALKVTDAGLHVTLKGKLRDDEVTLEADAARTYPWTQAELEDHLFKDNTKLQAHRYPRPEPVRYRTPSRKTELRFAPNVEYDPNGIEMQVIGLIDKARTSVDLCLFEFSLPRVAEALVRAQTRGVKVRMVYDSREDDQPALKLLQEHRVPVRGDQRAAYMHNKFIVIDRRIVWSGSTNISDEGIYADDNNCLAFHSPQLAAQYTTEFEEMFVDGKFGTTSPANTSHDWIAVDTGVKAQVFFAPEDHAMDRIVEVVRGAKKSIRFLAFAYTSKPLFDAMVERMHDGVVVEGIFESRHAGWADIKIGPLNAAGAKVRFDTNPNALHNKIIIVDDRWVVTGSFNFSDGADTNNDENMLVIDSRAIAAAYTREFQGLMSTTDPSDPRIATSGMGGGDANHGDDDDDDASPPTASTTHGPSTGLDAAVDPNR